MMSTATDSTRPAAPFATMRDAMVVSQLRTSGVDDRRLIEAMARVPREDFVPDAVKSLVYRDTQLPLGGRRMHNTPLATARLLNEAGIEPGDRVLLIGAAGGYAAALLSGLAHSVVAVEEAPLAADARAALAGLRNVEVVEGKLSDGAPDHDPFDVLMIDGAVEALPDALVEQAKDGARIVTGLVDRGVTRLAAGRRTAGGFGLFDFVDIDCAVLPGFDKPRSFQF
ncbi:protein-L-isoaspartate O-methyltransferase family protein [Sphingomonas aestuarii]